MRVAFLGTAPFAVPTLEALLASHHEVVGVVTGPDKPAGRGRELRPTAVKRSALDRGVPQQRILTPARLKDPEFHKTFRSWELDAAVVVAFRILPPEVFNAPRYGTLNVHPSLLPRYRGPAPINWALMNGDDETGVSVIRITEEVDAGGVVLQRRVAIDPRETADDLARRLAPIGGEMVLEALEGLREGTLEPIAQDESKVTRAPKLSKEDGWLDFTRPAEEVHNLVRAVQPWPGAHTKLGRKRISLHVSRPVPGEGRPGEVLAADETLVVACGAGAVEFHDVQLEGKKRMTVSEFVRGRPIPPGTILGE